MDIWIIGGIIGNMIAGFFVYYVGSAPETGKPNRFDKLININTSLRWKIWYSDSHILILHIHHWIYLFGVMYMIDNIYIYGFCIGGIIQGLTYKDRWKILYWDNFLL